jgi:subtilisin family serine protease
MTGTSAATPHVAGLVALYIAANGRATNAAGVYAIRQAIVNASLPQSQWNTNNTHDPDTNPEPLAIASEAWVPKPALTNTTGGPGNFQVRFAAVPGYNYTVQTTTNLAIPSAWTNLATVSGSSNVMLVAITDTNAARQNFYRLARDPSP